jgi:archaellum component FlaC
LERNELRIQLEKLMDDLKSKTKNYESELKNLTESLNMHETNVSKLTKEYNELIDSNSVIQNDYNLMKQTSKEQHSKIEKLTKEIDELKFLLESTSKDSQYELKVKLDILNKELNAKWTETLRYVSYEKLIDFLFFNSLFLL